MMAETSTKWTTGEIRTLKRKVKAFSKNTAIIGTNCYVTTASPQNHLPGETLTMLFNSILPYLQTKTIHKDVLGRCSAITLTRKHTSILFITVYRIPNSSDPGPYTSCSQYNEIQKRIQTTTYYRKQLLNDIAEYVHSREEFSDIVLMGDINQDLSEKRIKEFFLEIGVYDAFSTICEIPLEDREKTFVRRTKCIYTVAVSYNILPFISKIKLDPFSIVIENDHVGFIWQFEADLYFKVKSAHLEFPENIALNPNRISHVNAFVKKAKQVAKCLELKTLIDNAKNHYIPEEIEFIDHKFSYIFNRATKYAEGPRINAPFSEEKLQVFSARRYWRKYCRMLGGARVNSEALEQDRKNGNEIPIRAEIYLDLKKELVQIELAVSKQNVSRYLKNGKVNRDEFLYDLRTKEYEKNDKKGNNKRTIIKAIAKSESMKSTFRYLTSTVGKGDNSPLTMVITYNNDNEVIKISHDKETVEKTIIEYNTKHFKQALKSNICCDKIFPRLSEAAIQQSIVKENLPASECADPAVYDLLLLLRADIRVLQEQRKPITINELIQVVKKAKKKVLLQSFLVGHMLSISA